jgi:hypothetical protein
LNQVTFALLLVSVVPLIAGGFWLTVRSRRAKQEAVIPKPAEPAAGAPEGLRCYYLATTFRDNPLERVWAHRLGGRGNADVSVGTAIDIVRVGEPGIKILPESLIELSAASATIDRGVERGGITNLHWKLGETEVITSLRFVDPNTRAEFEKAVGAVIVR